MDVQDEGFAREDIVVEMIDWCKGWNVEDGKAAVPQCPHLRGPSRWLGSLGLWWFSFI